MLRLIVFSEAMVRFFWKSPAMRTITSWASAFQNNENWVVHRLQTQEKTLSAITRHIWGYLPRRLAKRSARFQVIICNVWMFLMLKELDVKYHYFSKRRKSVFFASVQVNPHFHASKRLRAFSTAMLRCKSTKTVLLSVPAIPVYQLHSIAGLKCCFLCSFETWFSTISCAN